MSCFNFLFDKLCLFETRGDIKMAKCVLHCDKEVEVIQDKSKRLSIVQ